MAINTELVGIALARVDGSTFERFVNDFYPSLAGAEFFPLGGVKDGGADAFGGDRVYERGGSASVFYQASVQEDFRAKIRHTVARLKEFGRKPRSLVYLTSRVIRHIDTVESDLEEELEVSIRIRDGAYIASQINADVRTRSAFDQHLRHLTDFLKSVGASQVVAPSVHVRSPAVYVFLRQELDRRAGNQSLVNSVLDSLALWALEGTDPDLGKFMTVEEVEQKILGELPAAASLVKGHVQGRLESLSSKSRPDGRKVNWYRSEKKFCLPFETREAITDENTQDEALRLEVLDGLYNRASKNFAELGERDLRKLAELTLRAFQLAFEREGLEFSHFITKERATEYPTMADAVREALAEGGVTGKRAAEMGAACLTTVRGCFYDSTQEERTYLSKLARTYALLFVLNTDPRLVQYFQDMAAGFKLYVGSDLLVRALSERFLPEKDQLTKNVLIFAAKAGTRLILTQPVLEEVVSHIRASDLEFKNHIQRIEHRVTPLIAANVPKILIRAYLYARLDPREELAKPASWAKYIESFCDYRELHSVGAEEQFRHYLQYDFSMQYQSKEDLQKLTDSGTVEHIAELLLTSSTKSDPRLARNDALLACAVYGERKKQGEVAHVSEFGYNTWWLTQETRILRHTKELERENNNVRYMMRPDFLLNFLSFAPSVAAARNTFGNVFPSLLGINLSRRMDAGAFHQIMKEVAEAEEMDDARRNAVMAKLADQLKTDMGKRYMVEMPK